MKSICLFYVVFLNKRVGFEPWFQGFKENENTLHTHGFVHRVANTLKCTLELVNWNILCAKPENYCILFDN